MGDLLSEVDLREISERCDQVETIVGPPGTQGSAEEWCYLLRSHEISPLCDEAQCDIRRLIPAYEALRARLESAEAAMKRIADYTEKAGREDGGMLWAVWEMARAALGAAGERENANGS